MSVSKIKIIFAVVYKQRYNLMKKFFLPIVVLTMVVLLGSCSSGKDVPYFQNIDEISLAGSKGLYDAKIMPKDMLTITVSTTDPAAAAPFNLSVGNTVGVSGQLSNGGGNLQGYLVDNDGNINFPVIGHMHVQGMTKSQCQDMIREKLLPYMAATENPIVTVRMSSYRVTVTGEVNRPGVIPVSTEKMSTGEVNRPGVIPVSTEKMSIVEALAQAGDLTVYGKRDNIMLIREDETGQKKMVRLNMNDANLINSPYYYLQQNDIIYVQPNSVKAKNAGIGPSTTLWFSFIGIVTSISSLLVNILRN